MKASVTQGQSQVTLEVQKSPFQGIPYTGRGKGGQGGDTKKIYIFKKFQQRLDKAAHRFLALEHRFDINCLGLLEKSNILLQTPAISNR